MKRGRRVSTGAFKAQVALEAFKERETLAELSKRVIVLQKFLRPNLQRRIPRLKRRNCMPR